MLESLYACRNSDAAVGHGSRNVPDVTGRDASFILGVASVAIQYLDSLRPTIGRDDIAQAGAM